MSNFKDCKNIHLICKYADSLIDESKFDEDKFNKAIGLILEKMKDLECIKSNVTPDEFINCKLYLSSHKNNKKIFIQILSLLQCECKCEKYII